jgi:Skp family chaperone for outer membrane proteins
MRTALLTLLVLAAFTFQSAYAQSPEAKALQEKIAAELKKIDARLKLTSDQKTALKEIMVEEVGKLDVLEKEYDAKETEILDEYKGKMRGVLTTDQQQEWDKIKKEYQARMKAWKEQQAAKAAQK